MSLSRSTTTGLAATATVAGLALAGCHSGSGSAASSGATSAAASGTHTAAAGSPTSSSVTVSGAGSASFFPAQVGDTWVYTVNSSGTKSTVRNQSVAVSGVSAGTQVTMKSTDSVSTTGTTNTFTYVIHPDGSIAIPVDTGEGGSFKLTSGGLAWPTPAQIASGKPQDDTLTMSGTESGKSVNITAHAVFTGEGTQSVTVPAGSYTATVIDETETEKILGYPSTFNIKTWLVSGVGPVKEEMTSTMDGSSMLDQQEELTSFVKG